MSEFGTQYTIYKNILLRFKEDLQNKMISLNAEFNLIDKIKGDESDLAVAHQEEHAFLVTQNRYKSQLLEIEYALSRIENGNYGICEITLDPIEETRLMAIPWTRFSVEGAEIYEEQILNKSKKNKFYFPW